MNAIYYNSFINPDSRYSSVHCIVVEGIQTNIFLWKIFKNIVTTLFKGAGVILVTRSSSVHLLSGLFCDTVFLSVHPDLVDAMDYKS